MLGDLRLHAMIDHNLHVGIALEDGQEIVDVAWHAERLEPQSETGDRLEGPLNVVTQHPVVIRDVLDHRPHSLEFRVAGKPLEL